MLNERHHHNFPSFFPIVFDEVREHSGDARAYWVCKNKNAQHRNKTILADVFYSTGGMLLPQYPEYVL
jgi:hypothetical protein